MADLLPTDQFLVNRSNTTSTVTSENLMATILDDDLMLVNRGDQTYKVTGADVKDSLGSKPIYPEPDEITGNPGFESGSGTEVDPFILKTIDVRPGGSSGFSVEEITIDVPGTTEGQPVVWTDNSVDAGARFTQPSGVTSVGGSWTGRLVYTDAPATLVDTEYVGKLQIGDAYFQWTVTQGIDPVRPIDPTPDEVTANPPFLSGIGTQVDPFILNPSVAAPSGSAIESVQEITIAEAGAAPGELVRWIDNSVDAGVRFTQPEELTDGDGKWVGRLDYFDDPATETDEIYTGDLQIGEVYFRWQVTQLPTADIRPEPGDITANPDFQSGSGTVGDPYVLQSIEVRPAGSTGTSVETLTITAPSGVENLPVVWTVNAGGDRFEQQVGITGPGGVWTGKLSYIDTPDTSSDQPYTGLLQIGTVYFSWTVDQFVLATVAPEIAAVSLVESNPTADPRFTDQEFVASVSMTEEGQPVSEKTIDAYVEGSITTKPITDEIESVAGNVLTFKTDQDLANFDNGDSVSTTTTKTFDQPLESSVSKVYLKDQENTGICVTTVGGFDNEAINAFDGNPTGTRWQSNKSGSDVGGVKVTFETPIVNTSGLINLLVLAQDLVNQYYVRINGELVNVSGGGKPYPSNWSDGNLFAFTSIVIPAGPIETFEIGTKAYSSGPYLYACDLNAPAQTVGEWQAAGNFTTFPAAKSTELTFAAGTPMEPLAAGDSVFQTNNFTEPLESSNTLPAPTATYTNCEANSEPVGRFFDGSSSTSWRVNSIRNPSATFPWTCQTDFPPQSFTRLAIYSSNVLYRGRLEHTFIYEDGTTKVESFTWETGARWQEFSDLDTSKRIRGIRTKVANNVVDFKFTGISFDWDGVSGPLAVVGASTSLTFAAGTDMAALAPGDAVSQPSQGISAQVWSDSLKTNLGGSITNPQNAFDGNDNEFATCQSDRSLYWNPGVTLEGDFVFKVDNGGSPSNYLIQITGTPGFETGGQSTGDEITYSGTLTSFQCNRSAGETYLYSVKVNGKAVVDGQPAGMPSGTVGSITDTTVALSDSNGTWVNGEDVTTGDKNSVGAISEINDTTLTLSSSSGVWVNGTNVYGNEKRGIGTVSSTDPAARTMTLITSNGGFCDYQVVEGPIKTLSNTKRYLKFDNTGAVTDLLGSPQNPAYKTIDANPGLTLIFPSTFTGSGQAPDDELGEGTTLTVSATAANDAGTDGPKTATVQPEGTDLIGPALNGLTTLYDGNNGTTKSIVNGINLVDNDGMVWIKSRDSGINNNWLFTTLLGDTAPLSSNLRDNIDNCNANYFGASPLITFQNNGFNLASQAQINSNGSFVSWTFAKAEGYFDVVTTDSAPGTFSHSLGQKPGMIIVKATANGNDWYLYHSGIPNPDRSYAALNKSDVAQLDKDDLWNVTETTFDLPGYLFGGGPISCVAYLFAEDTPNVIKCGSYTGDGSTEGQTITTGFKAQWVMAKNITTNADWAITDIKRKSGNDKLFPNLADPEESVPEFYPNDDGFATNGTDVRWNASGDTYIYVAIAAPPAARSLTQQEFAATRLNFETYANRAAVHEGEEAMAARQALIVKLREQGYTDAEIDAELGI